MARRHWTLLFLSDSAQQVKQYRFPRAVVQLAIAVVLVAVSTISSIGTAVYMKLHAPHAAQALMRKNNQMQRELNEVHVQVAALQTELDVLAQHDEKFRLVAGLEPINDDVQKVGIGGGPLEFASAASNEVNELLRRAKLLSFSWREARDTLAFKHSRLEATPSIVPTNGYITSAFSRSRKHPILNRARPHEGVDISAPRGTPIVAAAKGRIRFSGPDGDYGLSVEVDHGFGVVTRYAHASKLLVQRGQTVERGQTIGLVGETGLAVGPHLHYEVLVNGKPTNPRTWFLNMEAIAD